MCRSFQDILRDEMVCDRPAEEEAQGFRVDEEFKTLLLDLRRLCRLLEAYCRATAAAAVVNGKRPDPGDVVNRRDIIQHRVLALPRNDGAEICRLATLAFTLGVTYPLPRRRPLRLAATLLAQALQDPLQTKDQMPSLIFWAIMLGGLAAGSGDDTLAIFYRCRLKEAIDELGLRTWPAAKLVLQRFIWLGRACDEGGHALWAKSRCLAGDALAHDGLCTNS
jgi:hypothetical protein